MEMMRERKRAVLISIAEIRIRSICILFLTLFQRNEYLERIDKFISINNL